MRSYFQKLFSFCFIRTNDELQSGFQGDASVEIQERLDSEQTDEMPQKKEKGRRSLLKVVHDEKKQKLLFWILLYTLVLLAIFVERAYCKLSITPVSTL